VSDLPDKVVRRVRNTLRVAALGMPAHPPPPEPKPPPEPEPEYLLDTVEKNIVVGEFPFIAGASFDTSLSPQELEAEVDRLGHWEYRFELAHGLDTSLSSRFTDETVQFHRYRSSLISETVADLLGEDLSSASILDLACHCGMFSFDLAHRGAAQVHGIEYREKNLDQAGFIAGHYGIDNVSFEQGDAYDLDAVDEYDVVMCLGLLYHLVRPIDVLEACRAAAKRFVVVETICNPAPIPAYVVVADKNVDRAIEGTRHVELQPTYRGVIESLRAVGFSDITEVVGHTEGRVELFSDGLRRCFIARV
jgi:2-polyprenyl-3-methyl-5-hydroxy-6-metoxy-1,4-benzoquinol methylase